MATWWCTRGQHLQQIIYSLAHSRKLTWTWNLKTNFTGVCWGVCVILLWVCALIFRSLVLGRCSVLCENKINENGIRWKELLCVFMLDKLQLGRNITLITPPGSITAVCGLLFKHVGLFLFYIRLCALCYAELIPCEFHCLDLQWSIKNPFGIQNMQQMSYNWTPAYYILVSFLKE